MTSYWYWTLFAVAGLLWVAVPVTAWFEKRADERDRETWERIKNGRRS